MWEHIWHFFSLLILTRSRTFLYLCEKMSLKRSRQTVFIYMRTHQWFLNETRFCIYLCEDTSGINSNLCENASMILKWDQCLVFIYVRTHQWFSSETNVLFFIYVRTHQWFSSETNVLFLFMWEHINDSQVRPMSCLYLCENTSCHQWFSSEINVLSLFMWEHINDSQVKPRSCLYLCENTTIIIRWGQGLVFIYVRTHQ